jgi:hypothetical protein
MMDIALHFLSFFMKLKHGNFTWKFMSDEERMD